MKIPFCYLCRQSLSEKILTYNDDPEKLFTSKINKRQAYSFFPHYSFDSEKFKHNFYRGVESMKKLCAITINRGKKKKEILRLIKKTVSQTIILSHT